MSLPNCPATDESFLLLELFISSLLNKLRASSFSCYYNKQFHSVVIVVVVAVVVIVMVVVIVVVVVVVATITLATA